MKNIDACLSHKSDDWRTPTVLYNYFINHLGCVDCFPFKSTVDEFHIIRGKNIKLYANPPFSKLKYIPNWVKRNVLDLNNEVYLLIPSRTDTNYFHELLKLSPVVYFIKGRLHSNDSNSAPFPTLLLYFYKKSNAFDRFYGDLDFKKWIFE